MDRRFYDQKRPYGFPPIFFNDLDNLYQTGRDKLTDPTLPPILCSGLEQEVRRALRSSEEKGMGTVT